MLDCRTWTATHWADLPLAVPYTMQGFAVETAASTTTVYGSQAVPAGTVEDSYLSKIANGTRVGVAVLKGAGHATIVGDLGAGRLIVDWAGRLVEFGWKAGTFASSAAYPTFGGKFQTGPVLAYIDREHSLALFYNATTKTATLRTLADVRNQVDKPLGKAKVTNLDTSGAVRLRQGWASWDRQLFTTIGDSDGGRELHSYDLTSGQLVWRRPFRFRPDLSWEEPEGVFVTSQTVLPTPGNGNPIVLIGETNRTSVNPVVRAHQLWQLRDPGACLTTDLGWMHTTVECVVLAADGTAGPDRPADFNLWAEKAVFVYGASWIATPRGNLYPADKVAPGRAT